MGLIAMSDMNVLNATAILLLIGCASLSSTAQGRGHSGQPTVRTDMLVSTSWLQEHLADVDLVVLYVGRDRSAYDAGHIPGARFVALDDLVQQHSDSLNDLPPVATLQALFESVGTGNDARIVLYGEGGGLLAARAYFTLDYLGHGDRAALLDGGIEKWTSEGKSLDRNAVHPAAVRFTPRVHPDILITTERMHEIVAGGGNGDVLLDSRPPREYDGTIMSDAVPKAGHLPGAHSLYWKTLLDGGGPSLLQPTQLHKQFQAAGADSDQPVVTYCRTGMQSSFTYFVAKYLGYHVSMYDGSVYEWVNRAGYELSRSAPGLDGAAHK
jgi:thiosulfate/3-mercaptopyruvate sulfurtransferase